MDEIAPDQLRRQTPSAGEKDGTKTLSDKLNASSNPHYEVPLRLTCIRQQTRIRLALRLQVSEIGHCFDHGEP
jgi:hypothetical protein